MKRVLVFSLSAALSFLILASTAFAAFVCTPMEFHLDVPSGEKATYTFWVRNRGDETIALKVYAGDFWIKPEGNEVFLEPGEVERSCAGWLELAPEELELAPDESRAIRFNINVPLEKSGTYWAMIFVEQTNKPSIKTAKRGESQFNILSFQRVGVRVFEDAPGAGPGKGRINEVNALWDKDEGLLRVDLKFENVGDVLFRCKATMDIKDMKGETVASVELDEFNSYPRAVRTRKTTMDEKLPAGQYTALVIVDYGAEYLVAGEAIFEVED